MRTLGLLAILLVVGVGTGRAEEKSSPLPELKPVGGKPVSIWFDFRTGNFAGASQIWGELRNDSAKPLHDVRVRFASIDRNGKPMATSSGSVSKLDPGETWSFEIRPKESAVRNFELKDVRFR
jgi:hypothetical protein